jgi:hypothetical protein
MLQLAYIVTSFGLLNPAVISEGRLYTTYYIVVLHKARWIGGEYVILSSD